MSGIFHDFSHWCARGDLKTNRSLTKSSRCTSNAIFIQEVPIYCTLPSGKTSDYYNLRTKCLPSLISPFGITKPAKNLFKAFDFKTL